MIRRYSPRAPRRPFQDFHFFAAPDPIANLESQFPRPPQTVEPPAAAPPHAESAPVEPPLQSPTESPMNSATKSNAAPARANLPQSSPSAKSEPPYTMAIAVSPEKVADLDHPVGNSLHDEDGEDEDEQEEQEEQEEDDDDEREETDFIAAADGLGRTINSLRKIRAAVAMGGPEPRAMDELETLESERKLAPAKEEPAPKPGGRKSAARLATPRKSRSRKPRRALVSQPRASHQDQCTICAHPYRAEIENEFMHWHTVGNITYDYKVSRSAVYRHAYALGLFSRRDRLLRFSLGHLIERAQDVEPTADSIVRAVHLFSRINDQGECVEPPAHVIVSSGGVRREVPAQSGRRPIAIQLDSPALAGHVVEPTADAPGRPKKTDPSSAVDTAEGGGTVNRP